MKKIRFISMMALVIMALCSCTNTEYQKAIPANATLVMKVDVQSIADKADFKNSKYKMLLDAAIASSVKGEDLKVVKEYMNDPQKMGFDLSTPLYIFLVGEETVGMTLKTGDEADLKEFLDMLNKQGMASKISEKDGLTTGTLVDEISFAYDKNTFLLLASLENKGASKAATMAKELMTMKESDSFASTEAFSRMNAEDQDVSLYMNGKLSKAALKDALEAVMPSSVDMKDMDALMSLNFEDGQATLKAKVWGTNDQGKAMIEEAEKNVGKIEGKYLDRVADNALIWVGMNVKGEWMLDKIKNNKSLKESLFMLERAIDIEQMLMSVDGDMAVEFQIDDIVEQDNPEYIVYANLKNSDFLADVDDWMETMKEYEMSMVKNGENQYELTTDEATYFWGVQDKDLFLSSENASRKGNGLNPLLEKKSDIKNSKVYIYVNLAKIPFKEMAQKDRDMAAVADVLDKLKSIVLKSETTDEGMLVVELKDNDENFLKQLLK